MHGPDYSRGTRVSRETIHSTHSTRLGKEPTRARRVRFQVMFKICYALTQLIKFLHRMADPERQDLTDT